MQAKILKTTRLLGLILLGMIMSYNVSWAGSTAPPIKPPVEQKKAKKKKTKRAWFKKSVKQKFNKRLGETETDAGTIFSILCFTGIGLSILFSAIGQVIAAGGTAMAAGSVLSILSGLASLAFLVGGIGALVIWSMNGAETTALVRAAGITFIVLTAIGLILLLIFLIIFIIALGGI